MSLAGKRLRDECCATCSTATAGTTGSPVLSCTGALVAPCSKCVATLTKDVLTLSGTAMSESKAVTLCQSYGLSCSSLFCAKCVASGNSLQQCASFGLSCACMPSGSAATSSLQTPTVTGHRALAVRSSPRRAARQSVSVAVNVGRSAASRARFSALSKCLQKAKTSATTMSCLTSP